MSKLSEVEHLLDLIDYTVGNLKGWMQDEEREYPALMIPAKAYVHYEPLGVVLILGSWNFPFDVTIGPLITAIAAGNVAVIKPSEISTASSAVMEAILSRLDPDCYQTVQGGPDTAAALTSRRWDLIVFTGSSEKGKLVAKAAAETMTPCILELGGKNPTVVDLDADLENAALRVASGRFGNAGQICVCPEYVFVHKKVMAEFQRLLLEKITQFYTIDPQTSEDYSRLISPTHTARVAKLLQSHGGELLIGGQVDARNCFISPTVIKNPSLESLLMKEEVFGPILSLFDFDAIGECIEFITAREKPLAVYYFGKKNKEALMTRTSSGAFVQNETVFQYVIPDLAFGGVGGSGCGRYHGIEGFRSMSNLKSIFEKDCYNGYPVSLRYPPHPPTKEASLLRLKHLASLSSREAKKALVKVGAVVVLGIAVMQGYVGMGTIEGCGEAVWAAGRYLGVLT